MAGSGTGIAPAGGLGTTLRRDAWWVELIPVVIVLSAFGIYATLRAFEGQYYEWGPYLTPFYSPLIDPQHHWWPWSPALLILGGPLGFRATCYYYRKAYYRAFFLDPPGCAVGEPNRNYRGESAFPFVLQNAHRYFFYVAVIFLAFLWHDAVVAFQWNDGFHAGLGTLIMLANVVLLSTYTFSCHSLRHLAGGKLDCFSCAAFGKPRYAAWQWVTRLNERHMLWAWLSLASVGLTDLYIRLVACGGIHDVRIF